MSKPDAEIDTTRPEKWTDISKLAKRLELPHESDCFERAAGVAHELGAALDLGRLVRRLRRGSVPSRPSAPKG